MAEKEYLKGFKAAGYFSGVTDTETGYSVTGTRKRLPAAVSCSKTDNKNTQAIPADDNPNWDVDSEFSDVTLTQVFRQVSLAELAFLTGGTIAADGTFEEGQLDNAPLVALNFCGEKKSGYRGYRYYCCKLIDYNYTLNTKGTSAGQTADVTLTYRCSPRAVDKKIRGTKDFATEAACAAWLASIPSAGAPADKPQMSYFTGGIVYVATLPTSDISEVTLYALTADVGSTWDAGDVLFYNGTEWAKY